MLVPLEEGGECYISWGATKTTQNRIGLKDSRAWKLLHSAGKLQLLPGMLQHSSEEQGVDSQVSEIVEKCQGKYAATKNVTEHTQSKGGGKDQPTKTQRARDRCVKIFLFLSCIPWLLWVSSVKKKKKKKRKKGEGEGGEGGGERGEEKVEEVEEEQEEKTKLTA